jgi:hypothetical protein
MMYRKATRDILILSGSTHTLVALSPLTQPTEFSSLKWLLYYRGFSVAYFFIIEITDIIYSEGKCLLFYTSWNYLLQLLYFTLATIKTYKIFLAQTESPHQYSALVDESMSFLNSKYVHRRRGWIRLDLILDVCLATSVLIAVVVWSILYPLAVKNHTEYKFLNWISLSQHGINIIFLLVDFVSTHHVVCFDAMPLLITWPTMYSVFAWIVHGTSTKGFWPYPFMEVNTPSAPLWYGGLLAGHAISFFFVFFLSKIKHSILMETQRVSFERPNLESDLEYSSH